MAGEREGEEREGEKEGGWGEVNGCCHGSTYNSQNSIAKEDKEQSYTPNLYMRRSGIASEVKEEEEEEEEEKKQGRVQLFVSASILSTNRCFSATSNTACTCHILQ